MVRGGGARTDLACFDTEVVALAIATCTVPVVTGVGHETDRSIADEVCYYAAKTPTAAAAFLVERVTEYPRHGGAVLGPGRQHRRCGHSAAGRRWRRRAHGSGRR